MEIYGRVRRAVRVEGQSQRAVAREFGLSRDTVRKMLQYAVPPGYQRQQPIKRPKLGPWLGVIDAILNDDKQRPVKQRHTSKRIFERLKEEHGFTGGYTIVKEYVRVATLRGQEVFVPLVHRPARRRSTSAKRWWSWPESSTRRIIWRWICRTRTTASWRHFRPRRRKLFWKAMCEPSPTSAACQRGYFTTTPRSRWRRSWAASSGSGRGLSLSYRVTICSPISSDSSQGQRQGQVEGLVGYARRNFMVPIPRASSWEELNLHLEADLPQAARTAAARTYRDHRRAVRA